MKNDILRIIDGIYPEAVALRREIHAHPELSGHEHGTAKRVFQYLKNAGLSPVYCVGKTGVAVKIKNGTGRNLVLRADMDALPLTEKNKVPYISVNNGVMHACGHDIHTACLAAAARVLVALKKEWRGTITAIFQPSEEVAPGGALQMIAEGVFPSSADCVLGFHVSMEHPAGTIGLKPGSDYASITDFVVRIKGKGGHGAEPHKCIDPIVCASNSVIALQSIISRESYTCEPAIVTVGTINAGTQQNIIPDEAVFSGTIRSFSEKKQKHLEKRVKEVIEHTAEASGASAEVVFTHGYPPGFNDNKLVERAVKVLGNCSVVKRVVIRPYPILYGEDFAYYQKKVPGLYIHLGVSSASGSNQAGLHTSYFLPDEKAIKTGIAVHVAMALDILNKTETHYEQ
jgi:amidohydrolase